MLQNDVQKVEDSEQKIDICLKKINDELGKKQQTVEVLRNLYSEGKKYKMEFESLVKPNSNQSNKISDLNDKLAKVMEAVKKLTVRNLQPKTRLQRSMI